MSKKMGLSLTKPANTEEVRKFIEQTISDNPVVVFSKTSCPYCTQAKQALQSESIKYKEVNLSGRSDGNEMQNLLQQMTGARTVPRVFIHKKCIGGGSETSALKNQNKLRQLVDQGA